MAIQWLKDIGQAMVDNTLHKKLKIEQHESPVQTKGEFKCSGRVSSSCST